MQENALHVGIMTVAVIVIVAVVVAMAVSVSMIMAMIKGKDTYQVDNQAYKTNKQKTMRIHFWRMDKTLNSFNHNRTRDKYEKDAVKEGSYCLNTIVSINTMN
jgi:uncharacterized protein YxeA